MNTLHTSIDCIDSPKRSLVEKSITKTKVNTKVNIKTNMKKSISSAFDSLLVNEENYNNNNNSSSSTTTATATSKNAGRHVSFNYIISVREIIYDIALDYNFLDKNCI